MPEMRWFRMHAEFATDPVVQCLSFDDQRHFVMLLCFKCSGLLDKEFPDRQKRIEIIRKSLGLDGKAWDEMRERLGAMGLIDDDLQPRNWGKRQYVSDQDPTAAERQRRHRLKKRNGRVTRDSRPPDTDTDTDTDTEQRAEGVPPTLNQAAWSDYLQHRKELKVKKLTQRGEGMAMRQLASLSHDEQQAVVDASISNGWTGLFPEKLKRNGAGDTDPYFENLRRGRC